MPHSFRNEERVAAEYDRDVVMPARERAALEVVQAQVSLELLVGALGAPALLHDAHDLLLRHAARQGLLKTGATWSGPVPGSLSWGFDTNFRMTSQTVNGTALAFGYDLDGLLTGAGALTLTLDTQNGWLNGTTLGAMTDRFHARIYA